MLLLSFTPECDTNQRFFKISSLASFISLVKAELIILCVYHFRHLHGCFSICCQFQPMKTGILIGFKFKFFSPLTSMIRVVQTTKNNLSFHQCCSRLFQQYCWRLMNEQCWTTLFWQHLSSMFHHPCWRLFHHVATTIVRSSSVNNTVGTMLLTVVAWTLFNHDNNIVDALFDEQCCINLINFYACITQPQP